MKVDLQFIVWGLVLAALMPADASISIENEAYYQEIAAKACGGETEVRMADGSRCDIVTEHYAIEVDWPHKACEALGQSLQYGFQANKRAGIVLIVDEPTDTLKLISIIQHYDLPITVWTIHKGTLKVERVYYPQKRAG